MIGAWTINVSGKIYGPYTSERMRAFAGEGRLTPNSLLAREGTTDWHEARDEPEFAELFAQRANPVSESPAVPNSWPAADSMAQFAIVVDLKSRTPGNLEQAISSLGAAYRLLPNVWIVSTDQTANAVRNRLVQELGKRDSLFVVDATRGKAAWFNFGPEADVRIRRVWQKAS
jgi:hypothetical protein